VLPSTPSVMQRNVWSCNSTLQCLEIVVFNYAQTQLSLSNILCVTQFRKVQIPEILTTYWFLFEFKGSYNMEEQIWTERSH